ncbi:MAG: threonine--tRNA ligase [candidate division Zixibacteria bacterium CG_4_9_14_3_um_filter_46_8]|nr:MAG: threonine--tRNA ligase [candidate division Zixibacteria bacterium CG_4_9_14_3_um_filter_46_8]
MIKISLPDKSISEFQQPVTPAAIAKKISQSLAKNALGAVRNGHPVDLNRPIADDSEIRILTFDDPEGKEIYWHSTSHIMASAVVKLFPGTKVTIGPAIEHGFYYDFDREEPFTPADLEEIEAQMRKIIQRDLPFTRVDLSKKEALGLFAQMGETYKMEILDGIEEDCVSLYTHADFTDLCRGPHLPSTGYVKAFKLLSAAGAYWRGSEKNKMLQRIYGISFPKQKMLEEYLLYLEEAKKRDHRVLGPQLDLYSITDDVGAGLVLWHPKGAFIRHQIESFWYDEHFGNGYQLVNSPHIANLDLWKTSGHLDFYSENMYKSLEMESSHFQLKPMNCPFHIMIYKSRIRSYRDLPIRWAEMGTVYRYERSGVLHGLTRVRGFTQDDAHIFCSPEQMPAETRRVVEFSLHILKSYGFRKFKIYLSTKPEKFVGEDIRWDAATESLRQTLEELKIEYEVDSGGGAFYGPKIDINLEGNMGRLWQCSTIQFDFNLPERFHIYYIGADGKQHTPYMVHRALYGSLERFFGTLIEFYGGYFPLWLAPEQVRILPISERHIEYAQEVAMKLRTEGIRCNIDERAEKIGYRIREAENEKIPYMLILGDKEKQEMKVTIREHIVGDRGQSTIDEITKLIKEKVVNKELFKNQANIGG